MKQGMARTLLAAALAVAASVTAMAQSAVPVPTWQTAAGGRMSFEIATIKPADPNDFHSPSFALSADDSYGNPHGDFSGEFPLSVFIQFAYKLVLSEQQRKSMLASLPPWVATDRFAIHAKAEGNPTKDQMRLMVQSLLADRFKFAAHLEMHEESVLAVQLIHPGKLGPNLIPHDQGPPCPTDSDPRQSPKEPNTAIFPHVCDVVMAEATANHMTEAGSRNAQPALMANLFSLMGGFDRTVVDQTGLEGRYDFRIKWFSEQGNQVLPTGSTATEPQGPSFVQALREQLGLKLQATRATLPTLVIDHIEQPSPN
jgi:uncharacterized protein (TIGR03435 family)